MIIQPAARYTAAISPDGASNHIMRIATPTPAITHASTSSTTRVAPVEGEHDDGGVGAGDGDEDRRVVETTQQAAGPLRTAGGAWYVPLTASITVTQHPVDDHRRPASHPSAPAARRAR